MKYLIALFCVVITLYSCDHKASLNDQTVKQVLDSLQTNQAIIRLKVNNKPFYPDSSIFVGNGVIDEQGMKLSLKDQNFGNVIISIEGQNWFKHKPYKIEFKDGFPTGANMGSFLFGKITSTTENKGEGYILNEGYFEVKNISKDIFVVTIKGNLKQPFGDAPLSSVEGYVIWKNPGYAIMDNKELDLPFINEK